MIQLTKEQALEIAQSGIWKTWTDEEVVKFQLYQKRLCMDFSKFHEAIEKVLGRPVWTHEFAYPEFLQQEYEGFRPKPSFEEIFNMIPTEKTIFVVHNSEEINK